MGHRTAAEIFAPGEFISDELEARGWSQVELAEVLQGCLPRTGTSLVLTLSGNIGKLESKLEAKRHVGTDDS